MRAKGNRIKKVFTEVGCCIMAVLSLGLTFFCMDLDQRNVYDLSLERAQYWAAYEAAEETAYDMLDIIYWCEGVDGLKQLNATEYDKQLLDSNIHYVIYQDGEVAVDEQGNPIEFGRVQESYQYEMSFDMQAGDRFLDYPPHESSYAVKCYVPYWEDMLLYRGDDLTNTYQYLHWVYGEDLAYYALAGAIAGWMLTLVFLIAFLVTICKGKEENLQEIRRIGKIPADLYAGILALYGLLALIADDLLYQNGWTPWWMVLLADWIFSGIFFIGALRWLENVCLHVQKKDLWKSSILYRFGKWLVRSLGKHWPGIRSFCEKHGPMVRDKVHSFWEGIHEHINCICRMEICYVLVSVAEFLLFWLGGGLYDYEYGIGFVVLFFLVKLAGTFTVAWLGVQMDRLQQAAESIAQGDLHHQVDSRRMSWHFKTHARTLERIGDGMQAAVNERMKSEHFKTELITNVSHDIKTPLTSIINYVDLLQQEEPENEKSREYLEVLDRQSSRLKKLIEDLMEASKAMTGAITVEKERCQVDVMLTQTAGEYEERMKEKNLELIVRKPEEGVKILADGRHLWRVFDNLLNNILKYAQPMTRVYLDLTYDAKQVEIVFRNTSRLPLTLTAEELTERFVRGDSSRNTEGNGLGLSIAQSLTELMDGELKIFVDGDLFKVVLHFPRMEGKAE